MSLSSTISRIHTNSRTFFLKINILLKFETTDSSSCGDQLVMVIGRHLLIQDYHNYLFGKTIEVEQDCICDKLAVKLIQISNYKTILKIETILLET